MLDLSVVKQIVTEVTGVNGDLFRVGKRFLESKGKVYLTLSTEDKNGNPESYKFGLKINEERWKFVSYYYHKDTCSGEVYQDHNEKESLIWEHNLFENDNKKIEKNGKFIANLNNKLNS